MIICAIYDKKAKTYDTPFLIPNAAIAARAFAGQMQNEHIKKFCGDFELHQLGEFKNNEIKYNQEKDEMEIIVEWNLNKKLVKLADGKNYEDLPMQQETKEQKTL